MSVAVVSASPSVAEVVGNMKYFSQLNFAEDFVVKKPETNPKGSKSIQVDGAPFVFGEDMHVCFPIKTGFQKTSLSELPDWEKLPLVVSVTSPDIVNKSEALREHMAQLAVAAHTSQDPSDAWLPSMRGDLLKAKPEHRAIMATTKILSFVKEGKTDKDGKQYDHQATLKITGWKPYIHSLIMKEAKEDEEEKQVVGCVWRERLVTEGPLPKNMTQFFFWVPKINKWTDRLPVCDENGKAINFGTPERPVYKKRYVGPQDVKQHSLVTPVTTWQGIFAVADVGPTIHVRKLYVKAPEPRVEKEPEGFPVANEEELSMEDLLAAMAGGGASFAPSNSVQASIPVSVPVSVPASIQTPFAPEGASSSNSSSNAALESPKIKEESGVAAGLVVKEELDETSSGAPHEAPASASGERIAGSKRRSEDTADDKDKKEKKKHSRRDKESALVGTDDF